MKKKHLILISSFLFLLLISLGCLKTSSMIPCCDPDMAEAGTCVFADPSEAPDMVDTLSCDPENSFCTIRIENTSGGPPVPMNVPICSTHEPGGDCLDDNCTLMICGQFNYEPSILGGGGQDSSVADTDPDNAEETAEKAKKPGDYPGLYTGECVFAPFNYQTNNVFQNAEGDIYVNSFRLGVGDTFKEYEKYKNYFPITDKFCGLDAGQDPEVDRYMNYLLPPQEAYDQIVNTPHNSVDSPDQFYPLQELTTNDYCTQTGTWTYPLSTGKYDGSLPAANVFAGPNQYVFVEGYADDIYYSDSDPTDNGFDVSDYWYAALREEEIESAEDDDYEHYPYYPEYYYGPDKGFYSAALYYTYFYDIQGEGRAPYECNTQSFECLSGNCDTSVYRRTVCIATDDDGNQIGVPCACEFKTEFHNDETAAYIVCDAVTEDGLYYYDVTPDNPNSWDYDFYSELAGHPVNLNYSYWWGVARHQGTIEDYDGFVILQDIGDKKHEGGSSFPCGSDDWKRTLIHKEILFKAANENMGDWMQYMDGQYGYSYMAHNEFSESALVKACQMVEGVDYTITNYYGFMDRITDQTGWHLGYSGDTGGDTFGFYLRSTYEGSYSNDGDCDYAIFLPKHEVKVNDLGICEDDPNIDGLQPWVTTFGWCEPCTYSTLAYESNPDPDDLEGLSEQVNFHLRKDVLPIVDFSDNVYWENADASSLEETIDFFAEAILGEEFFTDDIIPFFEQNTGPIIVIVGTVDHETAFASPNWMLTLGRAQVVKAKCPKCLVSVHISEGAHGEQAGSSRKTNTLLALNNLMLVAEDNDKSYFDPTKGAQMVLFDYIDIIAVDFYPDELAATNTWYCNAAEPQYEAMVGEMANLSNQILYRSGKPTIVLNFGLGDPGGTCFDDEEISGFFRYLFLNQKQMTKSAILGLVYTEIESANVEGFEDFFNEDALVHYDYSHEWQPQVHNPIDNTDGFADFTESFCGLQQASSFLVNSRPQYIYPQVFWEPQVNCTACTESDLNANQCGGEYLNCATGSCTMPSGESIDLYKCPIDKATGDCSSCDSLNIDFDCTLRYANGTVETKNFNPSLVSDPSVYPYYLANLYSDSGEEIDCCIGEYNEETNGKYLYTQKGGSAKDAIPIIYSTKANPYEDCKIYAELNSLNTFCGIELSIPIFDYQVECIAPPGAYP